MQTTRSVINISVPHAMEQQILTMAREENKTKSELLREAFRVYRFRKDWAKIRAWGDQIARRVSIETYDDIERVAG